MLVHSEMKNDEKDDETVTEIKILSKKRCFIIHWIVLIVAS